MRVEATSLHVPQVRVEKDQGAPGRHEVPTMCLDTKGLMLSLNKYDDILTWRLTLRAKVSWVYMIQPTKYEIILNLIFPCAALPET